MILKEYTTGREFMGRLDYDSDLYNSLTAIASEMNIETGVIELIGACRKAKVAIYDQEKKTYNCLSFEKPMEILSCTGNISKREGKTFLHLHITLAGEDGMVVGGHVLEGTRVFAGEFYIRELKGAILDRKFDETTGLALW
jgi:hypothetical protein